MRIFVHFTCNAYGSILGDCPDRITQCTYLIGTLNIRNGGKNPGISHEIICIAALQKGMSKGQNPAIVIHPGYCTDSSQSDVAANKLNTYRTAWFQLDIINFLLPGRNS